MHSTGWFGFGVILKDSCRPQGPGIKRTNDHFISTHGSSVDAWMDEESGNIIHWPCTFTGTEKYSWFVDGSSQPSPLCGLRHEWRSALSRKHCDVIYRFMGKYVLWKKQLKKKKHSSYIKLRYKATDKRCETATEHWERKRKAKTASSLTQQWEI